MPARSPSVLTDVRHECRRPLRSAPIRDPSGDYRSAKSSQAIEIARSGLAKRFTYFLKIPKFVLRPIWVDSGRLRVPACTDDVAFLLRLACLKNSVAKGVAQ